MMIGIKDFIRRGHADDVDACLVPEPEENQLCLSMKGAIRAKVLVTGRMAHGAMPLSGVNPNTRLARIVLAFERFEAAEKQRCGADEFLGLPSVTFTVIQSPPPGSPAQLNVMPGEALAYVDIRTVPTQDHEAVRAALRGILAELGADDPDFKASIEFIEDRPVVAIGKDEPIVQASASAFADVTGRPPVYNGVPGATDGTFLSAWKGIPCLVNGPGPRHVPHQADEYVEVAELHEGGPGVRRGSPPVPGLVGSPEARLTARRRFSLHCTASMLKITGLSKSFGALQALDAVDIEVAAGTIHGIIGPNGSGKTTLFNCVTGLLKPDAGTVALDGRDITGMRPTWSPTSASAAPSRPASSCPPLTVLENVMAGVQRPRRDGRARHVPPAALRPPPGGSARSRARPARPRA